MIPEKEVLIADFAMNKAIDLLYDAEMKGPCQNRVWYNHIFELIHELKDCLEELHTGKEAKE